MQRYILRRLAQLIPSLLLITFMVFALMHAIPGDPARMMLGAGEQLDAKQLEIVRKEYNLDRPLPVQYVLWLAKAASGDFGRSTASQRRVGEELMLRAFVTFQLGVFAWLIGATIAVPAGIISAVYRGRLPDMLATMCNPRPGSPTGMAAMIRSSRRSRSARYWLRVATPAVRQKRSLAGTNSIPGVRHQSRGDLPRGWDNSLHGVALF